MNSEERLLTERQLRALKKNWRAYDRGIRFWQLLWTLVIFSGFASFLLGCFFLGQLVSISLVLWGFGFALVAIGLLKNALLMDRDGGLYEEYFIKRDALISELKHNNAKK